MADAEIDWTAAAEALARKLTSERYLHEAVDAFRMAGSAVNATKEAERKNAALATEIAAQQDELAGLKKKTADGLKAQEAKFKEAEEAAKARYQKILDEGEQAIRAQAEDAKKRKQALEEAHAADVASARAAIAAINAEEDAAQARLKATLAEIAQADARRDAAQAALRSIQERAAALAGA